MSAPVPCLTVAATVGRIFDLAILDRLMDDFSRDALIVALEEALSLGII